jgi:hypothetical protein
MNTGKAFLLSGRGHDYKVEPLVELPSAPEEIWEAPGPTLVLSTELGEVSLQPSGAMAFGACHPVDDERATLLQQLLDAPAFQAALASRKAPVDLVVDGRSFETPPALRYRGRPVRVEGSRDEDIRSGTRLAIVGALGFPSPGAARLVFDYPDLDIAGVADFSRGSSQWELQSLHVSSLDGR